MRAFIAIPFPEETIKSFIKLQDILKTSGADVKWVEPENIHLTLKFLGDISERTVGQISTAIQKIASGQKSFRIRTKELGVFPKPTFARVIWVGIDTGVAETRALAAQIEEASTKLGIPSETKPFTTHITLGRVRSQKNLEKMLHAIENASALTTEYPQQFTVSEIILYQSTLSPQGPVYEKICRVSLRK